MLLDEDKTKEQLMNELAGLRQRVAELEKSETERKQAEEALRESDKRYQLLMESSDAGINLLDKEGNFLLVNSTAAKVMGLKPKDIIGKKFRDLLPEELVDKSLEKFSRVMKTGIGEIHEEFVKQLNMYFRESLQPVKNTAGENIGVQVMTYDITERKQAEEKIQQQNEFLNKVLESLTHPFYVIDANDYTIKIANQAAKLGNLSKATTCYALTHKRDKPCVSVDYVCPLEEVKKTRKPVIVEHIHYDKDGKPRNIEAHGYPIFDTKGNVIQMIEYCMDITERKRMELELREMQEELIRSERLAAIGQLAGGVGHELRNPLGAIKNAVYYIKGKVAESEVGQKEPRVMEFLNIMDDEVNSSAKIISDLLGFSRVGKPSVSPTQIKNVIEDALLHTTILENIGLTKKLDADLPEVEINADLVRQVLVNVITNAVEAMSEGGKLTIGARKRGKFLEVEIADTGSGIPQEAVDKIFDPLFTTKAKGIGLGLAVCRAIIDRHKGNIEVKSQVGKGTTFTIKLLVKAE